MTVTTILQLRGSSMRFLILPTIVFVFAALTSEVRAYTSAELRSECKELVSSLKMEGNLATFSDSRQTAHCWAFIRAVQQLSKLKWDSEDHHALHVCVPEETTLTQIIQQYMDFTERHRELEEEHAAIAVVFSLQEQWGCPGS